MVREQPALIQDVQTDEWWQYVTTPILETVRQRLRSLVKLIDKHQRKPIYTDFEDEMGGETTVELPGFVGADSLERFFAIRHGLFFGRIKIIQPMQCKRVTALPGGRSGLSRSNSTAIAALP